MNIVKELKKTYEETPREVKRFLKRALVIFIGWKLLYGLLLFPLRMPDSQLTHLTSGGTRQLLSWTYQDKIFRAGENCVQELATGNRLFCSDYVMIGRHKIIEIADGCNGLELMILYVGFLFCIPATIGRMISYTMSGIVMIVICNILRCVGLAAMNLHHHILTNIAHHYVFKLVVYGFIFLLWIAYSRKSITPSNE